MKNLWSLALLGQGDLFIHMVDAATFKWVTERTAPCPDPILKHLKMTQKEVNTYGTLTSNHDWDNNRALSIGEERAIKSFFSIRECLAWCIENEVHIVDEYEGYIY